MIFNPIRDLILESHLSSAHAAPFDFASGTIESMIPVPMESYILIRHPIYSKDTEEREMPYSQVCYELGVPWSALGTWSVIADVARCGSNSRKLENLLAKVYSPEDDFLDLRVFKRLMGSLLKCQMGRQVKIGYEPNAFVDYKVTLFEHRIVGELPIPPDIGVPPGLLMAVDGSWCFRSPFGLFASIIGGTKPIVDLVLAECASDDIVQVCGAKRLIECVSGEGV